MYSDFAEFYDLLTDDVGYERRSEYLLELFARFDRRPSLLLDLACGTGGFSNRFAKAGIQVIGVDISPDMLNIAREKSLEDGADVLYLCQDAAELDLYGTVDGIICCLDSLNHLEGYEAFCKALKRAALFLEKDRLFIFDVNTVFKHKEVLGNNTFVIENEQVFCVWQNELKVDGTAVDISLDFFSPRSDGLYERYYDSLTERAYNEKEISEALISAGLKTEAIFGDMSFSAPGEQEERIIYVTRKV